MSTMTVEPMTVPLTTRAGYERVLAERTLRQRIANRMAQFRGTTAEFWLRLEGLPYVGRAFEAIHTGATWAAAQGRSIFHFLGRLGWGALGALALSTETGRVLIWKTVDIVTKPIRWAWGKLLDFTHWVLTKVGATRSAKTLQATRKSWSKQIQVGALQTLENIKPITRLDGTPMRIVRNGSGLMIALRAAAMLPSPLGLVASALAVGLVAWNVFQYTRTAEVLAAVPGAMAEDAAHGLRTVADGLDAAADGVEPSNRSERLAVERTAAERASKDGNAPKTGHRTAGTVRSS